MSGITPLVRLPLQLELGVEGCGEGAASPGPRAGGSILGRPSKPQSGMIYTFEDFELDTDRYELRQAGAPLAVEPQVFDVLLYLVEHGDRVVTKQELFENVWKTRFVTDSALTSRIKAARRAVGDDGRSQRLIATAHGRGYRFLPPVAERPASPGERNGFEPAPVPKWLVGREEDLDALRRRWSEVRWGRRRTVVITGGPGLGKTTLIEAFLGELGSGPLAVAQGYCLEHQGAGERAFCVRAMSTARRRPSRPWSNASRTRGGEGALGRVTYRRT